MVVTLISGLETSGASWMGMRCRARKPKISTIITAAITAVGRLMAPSIRFI